LVLIDSTSFHEILGNTWTIEPQDGQEWLVTIPEAARSTVLAFWTLRDSTGSAHQRRCEPGGFQ
jgi:hypothetical protein